MNVNSLEGRTVIVTGGTKGIGASIAGRFCEAGCSVIIGARSDNGLASRLGERARFVQIDVRRREDHERLVKTALEWTGKLDVFVNDAGFSEWRPIDRIDEEFWQRMLDTNLKGTFLGCQAAAAALGQGGCIINVSSIAGKRGTANNAVYCASKFGVDGLTQALAKELGARGIRVNAVCPVLVRTDGLVEAIEAPYAPANSTGVEQFLRNFIQANSALGRLPEGREVADVCLFLASPAASAVTAQCLNVDCGVFPQ